MENSKEIVKAFYTDCLTVNEKADPATVMEKIFANDFQSINAKETKDKATISEQIMFFWKLIPDLKWVPEEILQDGNRIIVRSTATGSPKGNFMGMILDGSKSFKIMSIDIHTVENEQIKKTYHQEEWTTAIAQLKG
ncbi:MAG: ester cyclase [Spirochaetales bacterium]|nr:ester cyclase [Spirochaetales bacterium]